MRTAMNMSRVRRAISKLDEREPNTRDTGTEDPPGPFVVNRHGFHLIGLYSTTVHFQQVPRVIGW